MASNNRQSPDSSAANYSPGTKKTGSDGNIWQVKKDVNGRHLWIKVRDKSYLARSKSKSKSKNQSKSKNKSKSKSKSKSKNYNIKTRKSPSKSATIYKVGTKKTGNDGNKWTVVKDVNGVKKWIMYKK